MKLGVISDTHRNKEYLENAVDWMIRKQHIATLFHLGDDYEDVMDLADRYIEIIQVPGTYHPKYLDNSLPHKVFETIMGITICLMHALEKDYSKQDHTSADIILYGHTHQSELRLEDGVLFMNPGHCKGPLDKNLPPTFGLLDIQDKTLTATIYDLKFEPVQKLEMLRLENGLYKA